MVFITLYCDNFIPENFVNTEWMSLDLIDAVVNWNKK